MVKLDVLLVVGRHQRQRLCHHDWCDVYRHQGRHDTSRGEAVHHGRGDRAGVSRRRSRHANGVADPRVVLLSSIIIWRFPSFLADVVSDLS